MRGNNTGNNTGMREPARAVLEGLGHSLQYSVVSANHVARLLPEGASLRCEGASIGKRGPTSTVP